MHNGGEKTDAPFQPVKRLLRFWRRADRRGRVLAAGAGAFAPAPSVGDAIGRGELIPADRQSRQL